MAIVAVFRAKAMTAEQYDESIRQLEAAGQGAPQGRRLHVAAVTEDETLSVDVWESEEEFARFGAVLAPIVAGLGLTPPQPEVHPVHNIVE
jgi:hypothetical protein